MADDNITNQDELEETNLQDTPETTPPKDDDPKDNSVIRSLRKTNNSYKKQIADLNVKLEELSKGSESSKTLEEKVANLESKLQSSEQKAIEFQKKATIEKALLTNNVDPKLSKFLIDEAYSQLDDETDLNDIIENLKSEYSTAFQIADAKPIGKVGTGATTSKTKSGYSRSEIEKLLADPNTPLTDELDKAARELGF
jgi:predicted RNase H-like nuclease (RuvC/YqgF family)